jgi:hypothetical protein
MSNGLIKFWMSISLRLLLRMIGILKAGSLSFGALLSSYM